MLALPELPIILRTDAPDVLLVELSTPKDDEAYLKGVQTSKAHLERFEPGIAIQHSYTYNPTLAAQRAAEMRQPFGIT